MKWISSYIRVLSNLYRGKFYGARHFRAVSLIVAACSAMSVSLPTERPGDLVLWRCRAFLSRYGRHVWLLWRGRKCTAQQQNPCSHLRAPAQEALKLFLERVSDEDMSTICKGYRYLYTSEHRKNTKWSVSVWISGSLHKITVAPAKKNSPRASWSL